METWKSSRMEIHEECFRGFEEESSVEEVQGERENEN